MNVVMGKVDHSSPQLHLHVIRHREFLVILPMLVVVLINEQETNDYDQTLFLLVWLGF